MNEFCCQPVCIFHIILSLSLSVRLEYDCNNLVSALKQILVLSRFRAHSYPDLFRIEMCVCESISKPNLFESLAQPQIASAHGGGDGGLEETQHSRLVHNTPDLNSPRILL